MRTRRRGKPVVVVVVGERDRGKLGKKKRVRRRYVNGRAMRREKEEIDTLCRRFEFSIDRDCDGARQRDAPRCTLIRDIARERTRSEQTEADIALFIRSRLRKERLS